MDAPNEAPEDFPHLHHVKAIGQHDDLLQAVRGALLALAPDLPAEAFRVRVSGAGRYSAVTCSLMVDSAEHLQAIYAAVQEIDGVMLCL